MKFTFTGAGPTTTASLPISDPGNRYQTQNWHAYVSGVFGANGTLQFQISPDNYTIADASSRWFSPSTLLFTSKDESWFSARFRKVRAVFTGGDGTTNLVGELV